MEVERGGAEEMLVRLPIYKGCFLYLCNMKEKRFTTTLRCGGCTAKITPLMEAEPSIEEWSVDLESEGKVLTVRGNDVKSDRVLELLKEAGFEGKEMKHGIFKKVFG